MSPLSTPSAPAALGPYSQGIDAGRSCVQAAALPRGARLEVEAIAVRPS